MAGFGLIIAVLVARWWLSVRGVARTLARIAPALVEAGEFFALLDFAEEKSHFLERHGPMLKTCEVLQRAETGRLDVSGYVGSPVTSARWFRHADLLHAVTSAAEHWASGARPKRGRFIFEFEKDIGEGFLKGGSGFVRTRFAVVIIREGVVVTAYPLLVPTGVSHPLVGSPGNAYRERPFDAT